MVGSWSDTVEPAEVEAVDLRRPTTAESLLAAADGADAKCGRGRRGGGGDGDGDGGEAIQ